MSLDTHIAVIEMGYMGKTNLTAKLVTNLILEKTGRAQAGWSFYPVRHRTGSSTPLDPRSAAMLGMPTSRPQTTATPEWPG